MFVTLYMVGHKEIIRKTWWDETVESLIKQKIKVWKEWQKGGSREKYLEAKKKAESGVYVAKRKVQEKNFVNWKVVIAENSFSN